MWVQDVTEQQHNVAPPDLCYVLLRATLFSGKDSLSPLFLQRLPLAALRYTAAVSVIPNVARQKSCTL